MTHSRTGSRVASAAVLLAFLGGLSVSAHRSDSPGPGVEEKDLGPASQPAPEPHWLAADGDEQRDQLERQLRGLDITMMEIGHRFIDLYFAGQDRNWPHAQYQIEKIDLALRLSLERRPKRAASAKPFLEETIPLVKQAIHAAASSNDQAGYDAAMERLRTDCMKCHVAENVPHFTVYFPEARVSPIRPENPP